ncbi:MAG: apolipoprotein N-acyltransferase [Azoarcus sp.]|jgi:apolipoprotein N-acyltransferase|nr:apolipoprotein N-acyltransferase [Azoarcus sp.]
MNFLLALLSGALAVPAFAPLEWWPFAFLSLMGLALLLERAPSARAGFGLGLAWGLGCFAAGVSWIYVALERYGGMQPLLAGFAILLFCAFLALYPALCALLYVRLRRGGLFRRAALFAALWLISEWLRGTVFTGFPWLAIGYSQTPPSLLAGFFPLIGVYGVGGLTAFIAGLLGLSVAHVRAGTHSAPARMPAIAIVLVCGAGFALAQYPWAEPDGEPLTVSLLQPNVEPTFKWDPDNFNDVLRINADLVAQARGALVVLPETALPAPLDRLPDGYLGHLANLVDGRGASLVTGVFTHENGHYQNAALTLGAGGGQRYAKHHLVPFGEYSPPLFGWFYRLVDIPMSQQLPGAANQAPLELQGRHIALDICYEDIFGAELATALPRAGLMLNLSNLAWYGDSFAQPQHLQIARVRAMESGRPMLRATNTGMTALALPNGKVEAMLPAFTRGVLETSVTAYRGATPFGRWGDWPALVVALGALVLSLPRRKRIPAA